MIVLFIILALILVLVGVCVVRALMLKPDTTVYPEHKQEFTDEEALERFRTVLQQKTIWPRNGEIDYAVFEEFLPLLNKLYPDIMSILESETINEYGILLKWKGKKSELQPVVLMSHYDVVAANESKWTYPPFGAEIHDETIWARGTVDTKCILCALLEAADYLNKKGFEPERDIYFFFTNNEETGGETTPATVKYFVDNNIQPWLVLDEGGAVFDSPALNVKETFAMIGVSEKGVADTIVTVSGEPGHSSTPSKNDSTTRLINAVKNIEENPCEAQIPELIRDMFGCIAPYASFVYRIIFANLWLFSGIVKKIMSGGKETSAMLRTTMALTGLKGSDVINIIPNQATATYSVRIAPWDSVKSVTDHIKKYAGDNAEVSVEYSCEPSPISDYKGEAFKTLEAAVHSAYPDVKIAPYLMTGGTDSKHFSRICPNVFRLSGFHFTKESLAGMHGNDEHLSIKDYYAGIDFYIEFIRQFN